MAETTKLSVNLNKIATLRNARGGSLPSVPFFAELVLREGAQGITVHPRPDERHIRKTDVFELSELVKNWNKLHDSQIEFNIEGFPSNDFLELVEAVRPDQATLVPDPPEAITSNAGWDLSGKKSFLFEVTKRLHKNGVRVSLFVDPHTWTSDQKLALLEIRPERCELYTESYAKAFGGPKQDSILALYKSVGLEILALGIELNAGHDLNQQNLGQLIEALPQIREVSIGHALISEALIDGMAPTTKSYLRILKSPGTL
jgi:pyridoxine 5-phosphate synthase